MCAGCGHCGEPHLDPGVGAGGGRGVAQKDLHRHLPAQYLAGGPHYLCLLLHLHPTAPRTGGHLRRLSRTDIRQYRLVLLRLFIGVVLEAVAVVLFLIGVDVAFSGMLSWSESDSSADLIAGCFLAVGAISFSISFWFSAKILVRSDIISFLSDNFISSKLSAEILGDLLVPATGFTLEVFSGREVSISVEISSSAAFLF